jgi:hypothetical protein
MKKKQEVYVAESKVGRGVFARRSFAKGEEVGAVNGNVIPNADYGSDYCIDLLDGRGFEPAEPFRFLNHSCEPNCELIVWEDEDEGVGEVPGVSLFALIDLVPETELTIDYAWPAESTIPCWCGAASCRGWIVSERELHQIKHRLSLPSPSSRDARNVQADPSHPA